MSVAELKPAEPVTLDRDQLEVLYRQLGPVGADKVVHHALEELAALLSGVNVDYHAGRMAELAASGRALAAVAQQVGMTKLARVARDVADVAMGRDAAALGAVTARLMRIGDRSLVAVWDLADGIG
jgi:hypothetical protein